MPTFTRLSSAVGIGVAVAVEDGNRRRLPKRVIARAVSVVCHRN